MRFLLTCAALLFLTAPAHAQGWEAMQEGNVLLGVRDSQAPGDYQARFTVTAPDGKAYTATITAKGSAWGTVVFPEDFAAKAQTGRFTWACEVAGEVVTRGVFRLTFSGQKSFPKPRTRAKSFQHRRGS